MSGNGAAGNIEGFVYVSINAFQQTAVNFTGQNVGAGNYKRVWRTFWVCLGCVSIVGLVMGSIAFLFGRQLLSIYITDSAKAITYGLLRMGYICLPYFLCGIMDVSTGALRGMGASMIPMIISVLGVCGVRILWIYTIFRIPAFHTPASLYVSYPISWIITFLCQLAAYLYIFKKQARRAEIPVIADAPDPAEHRA